MSNQMTLSDRIAIEAGITAGKTFKEIALKINRNPATVSSMSVHNGFTLWTLILFIQFLPLCIR